MIVVGYAAQKYLNNRRAHEPKRCLSTAANRLQSLFTRSPSTQFSHQIYSPYVSVNDVARDFSISYQAASTLISQLEGVGILKEITGRKRDKRYIYADYLQILEEGTKL